MRKIFLTGGSGFLGSAIKNVLESDSNYKVLAPTRDELDLSNLEDVTNFWIQNKPDILIHGAAFARGLGGNLAAQEDSFIRNESVIRPALLAALKFGVEQVIFLGTVAEYAYPYECLPLREEHVFSRLPHAGEVYYGLAKRLSNPYLEAISVRWGASAAHLYLTNLYGPGDRFDAESGHVTSSMLLALSEGANGQRGSVKLWGSPDTTRDFLFVRDAASAIRNLLGISSEGLLELNIASGIETSMGDLATTICEALQYLGEIDWDTDKPIGIRNRSVDISKLKSIMNWHPTDLRNGILETLTLESWLKSK